MYDCFMTAAHRNLLEVFDFGLYEARWYSTGLINFVKKGEPQRKSGADPFLVQLQMIVGDVEIARKLAGGIAPALSDSMAIEVQMHEPIRLIYDYLDENGYSPRFKLAALATAHAIVSFSTADPFDRSFIKLYCDAIEKYWVEPTDNVPNNFYTMACFSDKGTLTGASFSKKILYTDFEKELERIEAFPHSELGRTVLRRREKGVVTIAEERGVNARTSLVSYLYSPEEYMILKNNFVWLGDDVSVFLSAFDALSLSKASELISFMALQVRTHNTTRSYYGTFDEGRSDEQAGYRPITKERFQAIVDLIAEDETLPPQWALELVD